MLMTSRLVRESRASAASAGTRYKGQSEAAVGNSQSVTCLGALA